MVMIASSIEFESVLEKMSMFRSPVVLVLLLVLSLQAKNRFCYATSNC